MLTVTLPDGTLKTFDDPVSVAQVAAHIGSGLAKAALAGKVDGRLVDTSYIIERDCQLAIITDRDAEGLEVIRHSTAHLLAQAVKQLYPSAQVTIGPVIEDGFYYDFAFQRSFTPEDLERIQTRMTELAKQDLPISRRVMPREEAIAYFQQMGEHYKAQIIQDIPEGESITLYKQGDFEDLCRGPHVPSTGKLKAFQLTKVAGAYWRGDANNEMLQRIYGTAWANNKDLKAYLTRIEEAEKRDHRKIGRELDFFHFQPEAPGMVFWHQAGWTIYQTMQQYLRELLAEQNYQEIRTPQIVDRSLWEKSGHWAMFKDEMFVTDTENRVFAIKPMNCPCHIQVFNSDLRSYRELPIRLAEFGNCHRCEPSGALHGLMRVRNFVQDDGHIFCTEAQIQQEVSAFLDSLLKVYRDFGFDDIIFRLATRPERHIGSADSWQKAEQALANALTQKQLDWDTNPGEGAFYGPKIECSLRDCLGRVWQCGTMQVDFSMPERLGAHYIAEDGSKQIPVMLHRAILGTFERFMGILIEHYAGKLPAWLSPLQAVVMTITDEQQDYVRQITKTCQQQGFRAHYDLRNEKISFKIRQHTLNRVPYLVVVGNREVETNTVAVRTREGEDLGSMPVEQFLNVLQNDVTHKRTTLQNKLED
jgi:threonyl-tRNA synthetase